MSYALGSDGDRMTNVILYTTPEMCAGRVPDPAPELMRIEFGQPESQHPATKAMRLALHRRPHQDFSSTSSILAFEAHDTGTAATIPKVDLP